MKSLPLPKSIVVALLPSLLLSCSISAGANSTETTGQAITKLSLPYDKVTTIDGVLYGLKKNTQDNKFYNFTVITSYDDGQTWSDPKVVLSAADLTGKGLDQLDDYSLSQLRAIKWLRCPSTGTMSIWAKRHGVDANGKTIVKKELLRAAILDPAKSPSSAYTDSIIIDRPYGYSSGDLGSVVDNNTLHLVSAATSEGKINLYELNQECSDLVANGPLASLEWHNQNGSVDHREAPSIFKQDEYFYLTTSGKTGWRPNQQKYAYAENLAGPWSEMLPLGDSTAYHSQLFGAKKIVANDGSGNTSRIFSGTRNAETWNGTDNRRVWMPLYFNTKTSLATNYYDYIEIDEMSGTVTGHQHDHGTNLAIRNVSVENNSDDVSALTDNDLTTSWYNNNDTDKTSLVFELDDKQLVKALKLKHYDQYNDKTDVTLRTPAIKIEVSEDGVNYTEAFNDIAPSITWLQPIDIIDTEGKYIKLSLIENHKGNSKGTTSDFGFYQVEVWGGESNKVPLVADDFSNNSEGEKPFGWSTVASPNTFAQVTSDSNQLQLTDQTDKGRVVVSKSFTPQKGSSVSVSTKFKFTDIGKEEYVRLFAGTDFLVNIVNSKQYSGLAITDKEFNQTKIADINPDTWYELKILLNTDSQTYDIYINEKLVWGGAPFVSDKNYIDTIKLGTATNRTQSIAYFDDVYISGPISNSNN
ncbi:discoidin domain-containing protein [Photobacterium sagamiensis]|uniref:discoidin domain-containing protein n=1 Tax=Photobacterium sagamiensis TaxID=2910241 RepID=UPI003D144151